MSTEDLEANPSAPEDLEVIVSNAGSGFTSIRYRSPEGITFGTSVSGSLEEKLRRSAQHLIHMQRQATRDQLRKAADRRRELSEAIGLDESSIEQPAPEQSNIMPNGFPDSHPAPTLSPSPTPSAAKNVASNVSEGLVIIGKMAASEMLTAATKESLIAMGIPRSTFDNKLLTALVAFGAPAFLGVVGPHIPGFPAVATTYLNHIQVGATVSIGKDAIEVAKEHAAPMVKVLVAQGKELARLGVEK